MVAVEEDEEDCPQDENIFFVAQKALLLTKLKLQKNEVVDEDLVRSFASPAGLPDDEMVIPVDLRALDKEFPDEDLVDGDMRLDVDRLIARLGAKASAQALVKAQTIFLENKDGEPEGDRPKPMTAAEWRSIWEDSGFPHEEGMEEEMLEDPEEVEAEEEEEEDEPVETEGEPAAKRAKRK